MRIMSMVTRGVLKSFFSVPGADVTTNVYSRDVVGDKEDAAQTTVGTTRSIIAYVKGLLNALATHATALGTHDTKLDVVDGLHDVPTADAATDLYIRDVVGRKTDAAQTTVGTTRSIIAYVKGLLGLHVVPTADAATDAFVRDVVGRKTDSAVYSASGTKSLMAYLKGVVRSVSVASLNTAGNLYMQEAIGNKVDTAQTTVTEVYSIIAYVKGILNQTVGLIQKDRLVASTSEVSYQTKLEISGKWRLQAMALDIDAATIMYVKVTMDGGAPVYFRSDTAGDRFAPCTAAILDAVSEPGAENCIAACRAQSHISEGSVSLKIEMRSSTAVNSDLKVYYSAES